MLLFLLPYSLLATHYSPLTTRHSLNSLNDPLAEQALRPEQQEDERDEIGEPAFDAGAEQRAPVELADLFADPDDHAADDRTRYRREAAEDQHRQRLEGDDLQRE